VLRIYLDGFDDAVWMGLQPRAIFAANFPGAGVALTSYKEWLVQEALSAGAIAYLLKDCPRRNWPARSDGSFRRATLSPEAAQRSLMQPTGCPFRVRT